MSKFDKQLIQQRFSRSLPTYAAAAVVQRQTAAKLINSLLDNAGRDFAAIFEIGCGTGLLSQLIVDNLHYHNMLLNDLAPRCQQYVRHIPNSRFIPGDLEQLPPPDGKFNLIISNATFQWFEHLDSVLAKLAAWLQPGGRLAFSTFSTENLRELAALGERALDYKSFTDICTAVKQHFSLSFKYEELITMQFPTPLAVLQHLKATGVNSLADSGHRLVTRRQLQQFSENYLARYATPDGVALTYHPVIIIAEKSHDSR